MAPIQQLDDVIADLIRLLKAERARLAGGAFTDLDKIAAEKSRLTAHLEKLLEEHGSEVSLKVYATGVKDIKRFAAENEKLLMAARTGVALARKRIEAIAERNRTVGTYTADGFKLRTHEAAVSRQKIA